MSLLEREGELSAVTPFQLPEGANQLAVVVGTANLPVVSAVLPTTGANERCRKRTAWNRNTDTGHADAGPHRRRRASPCRS
jgi:hypothetical protein